MGKTSLSHRQWVSHLYAFAEPVLFGTERTRRRLRDSRKAANVRQKVWFWVVEVIIFLIIKTIKECPPIAPVGDWAFGDFINSKINSLEVSFTHWNAFENYFEEWKSELKQQIHNKLSYRLRLSNGGTLPGNTIWSKEVINCHLIALITVQAVLSDFKCTALHVEREIYSIHSKFQKDHSCF